MRPRLLINEWNSSLRQNNIGTPKNINIQRPRYRARYAPKEPTPMKMMARRSSHTLCVWITSKPWGAHFKLCHTTHECAHLNHPPRLVPDASASADRRVTVRWVFRFCAASHSTCISLFASRCRCYWTLRTHILRLFHVHNTSYIRSQTRNMFSCANSIYSRYTFEKVRRGIVHPG